MGQTGVEIGITMWLTLAVVILKVSGGLF